MIILLTIEEMKKVNPYGCFCGQTDNDNLLKAQLKKVYDWGNEDCPHYKYTDWKRLHKKHECPDCWAELKKEVD